MTAARAAISLIQLLGRVRNDPLARDASVVFSGNVAAGIFNALYYLAAARLLGVVEYGTFNASISILTIFTLALQPPHIALIRLYAGYVGSRRFRAAVSMLGRIARYFMMAAGAIVMLVLISATPLAGFLQTSDLNLIVIALVIATSLMGLNYTAFLNGHQRFVVVTLLWMLNPISGFVAGVTLMAIGGTATHALAGFVVGPLALLLAARAYCLRFNRQVASASGSDHRTDETEVHVRRDLVFPTTAVTAFALLTNVDMIAVKQIFTAADAGYYSLAQTLGKLTLFVPFALATVLLPKSVVAHSETGVSRHILHRALLIAATLCSIIVVLVAMWPQVAVAVIAGNPQPVSSMLAPALVLAMGFFALAWLTINYAIAVSSYRFIPWLLALSAGEIAVLAAAPLQLAAVPDIVLATSVLMFGAVYLSLPRH